MKPKSLVILTMLVTTFGWRILAQTNSNTVIQQNSPDVSSQTFLPWPPDPQRFRIIQGKLYSVNALETVYSQVSIGAEIEIGSIGKTSVICSSTTHEFRPNASQALYAGEDAQEMVFKQFIIFNYPIDNDTVSGSPLPLGVRALRVKSWNPTTVDGKPTNVRMEAFDCGLPDTIENRRKAGLPIPTPEQIAAQQKLATERIATAGKLATERAAAVKKAEQEKILKWNEEQAAQGDPYGLLRMGERYRDGDGVPKDLTKAREYLAKAAAAGSPDASNDLSKLNQISTNSLSNH